jgi:hypothetical protein
VGDAAEVAVVEEVDDGIEDANGGAGAEGRAAQARVVCPILEDDETGGSDGPEVWGLYDKRARRRRRGESVYLENVEGLAEGGLVELGLAAALPGGDDLCLL